MDEIDKSKLSNDEKAALAQVDLALKEHVNLREDRHSQKRKYVYLALVVFAIMSLFLMFILLQSFK